MCQCQFIQHWVYLPNKFGNLYLIVCLSSTCMVILSDRSLATLCVHTFPCALGCESYHTEGSAITGEAGCTAGPWLRGWPAASCATASSTRFCPALSGESSSPPGSASLTSRLLRQRHTGSETSVPE